MLRLDKAENLMRNGAFERAKILLTEILYDDPGDLRAICDIGIAYTETGEDEKAIRALEYVLSKDDQNPYAWEALGCASFRSDNNSYAKECLNRALELMPENPTSLRNLGIICGIEGRHQEGLDLLRKSVRLAPDDYRTLYALNFTFRDTGEKKRRSQVLDRLKKLELPDDIRKDVVLSCIKMDIGWE